MGVSLVVSAQMDKYVNSEIALDIQYFYLDKTYKYLYQQSIYRVIYYLLP
jgi:hypothetical protein